MAAIFSAILVIVRRTKLVFKLEQEFDESNPYMKFGRNPIKNDLSPSYTFTILATVEQQLTPIYQVVMHRHES